MKKVIVLGGGGFIGGHLAKRLFTEGNKVTVVDLHTHSYFKDSEISDKFIVGDLRDPLFVANILGEDYDELYQLASDVGGAGYISTNSNDADILSNSALININVAKLSFLVGKIFFASSSCVYPEPDGNYGFEKLFSEKLYLSYNKDYRLNVCIGRFQNVYGPCDNVGGEREKAVAALCRKVALAKDGESIEVWGDGSQMRSFVYVDDCVSSIIDLMRANVAEPFNIGSDPSVTINDLAKIIIAISKKDIGIINIFGKEFKDKYGFECPVGVRAKKYEIGYGSTIPLNVGLMNTYEWIKNVN